MHAGAYAQDAAAQDSGIDPSYYQPANQAASQPTAAPSYNEAQLNQILAPIALYPDPLLGQVLMASTYPLEVVEAARWLEDSNNASLTGDQLTAALAQQPWDPSVKALVAVPQVLNMLNKNLQWTEQLGNAFLAQQTDLMNSVQNLRQRAQAAGNLVSTPQETVSTQGSAISIEPDDPNLVYIPAYNPTVVYGAWPYPAYQPYYFYPPGYVWGAGIIGFGVGIAVSNSIWGWDRWDWYHHRIDIDNGRFAALNRGRPPVGNGVWQHNPDHRHGVPYVNATTRTRFQSAGSPAEQRSYRGYNNVTTTQNFAHPGANGRPPAFHTGAVSAESQQTHIAAPQTQRIYTAQPETHYAAPQQHYAPQQTHYAVPKMQTQRPATPVFESFSHGSDVRAQSARGAASRAAPAAPAFHASNNGGGGGNRGNTNQHR
jgi:hypothetical protein